MKLSKLVEHIEYELVQGSLDTEVADIAYDSRKIKEGMLFVAIAGTVVDGHKYIPDVVKKGASVLVDQYQPNEKSTVADRLSDEKSEVFSKYLSSL